MGSWCLLYRLLQADKPALKPLNDGRIENWNVKLGVFDSDCELGLNEVSGLEGLDQINGRGVTVDGIAVVERPKIGE